MAFNLEELIQDDINYLTKVLQEDGERIKTKMDDLLYNFNQYIKTGDKIFLQNEIRKHSHVKEYIEPISIKTTQQKKRVLADITENNVPILINNVRIKSEKISDIFATSQVTTLAAESDQSEKSSVNCTVNLNNDEMPAPKKLPPRKRKIKEEPLDMPKRSTRTRKKPMRYTASDKDSSGKVSDIMIHSTTIPVVDVTDDSDKETSNATKETAQEIHSDEEKQQEVEPVRSKRTRTVRKAKIEPELQNGPVTNKHTNDTLDEKTSVQKRAAEIRSDNQNATFDVRVEAEPANQNRMGIDKNTLTQGENANATFDVRLEPVIMNCTVVIEKSNMKVNEINTPTTPPKQKKKKEIFSPFDKVSTKAKVEAFEKLNAVSNNSPAMNTRGNKPVEQQKNVTPMASKVPTRVNSTTKVNKLIHRVDPSENNSILSAKSQSALKASQAEFRERLKKKQEKEQEALRKREALLLALSEEKRKKREEKQLKAQQQRELLEIEKLKIMEAQKLKDEKHKQALAEREEKLLKQKEESERKALLVKKRAEELKYKEHHQNPSLPMYMTTEAPLLPTDDCYDSDDEESERVQQRNIPSWSKDRELRKTQHVMLLIGEKIKNTFFSRQVHTPDLQDIFERIDPRKLKRTSSAVWRKPPRYTFFLESSSVQFSEDDE